MINDYSLYANNEFIGYIKPSLITDPQIFDYLINNVNYELEESASKAVKKKKKKNEETANNADAS